MTKRKNHITVHAAENGQIQAAILQPEGKLRANLIPSFGSKVIEIADHELHGDLKDEDFMNIREKFKVEWDRSYGRLSPLKSKKG